MNFYSLEFAFIPQEFLIDDLIDRFTLDRFTFFYNIKSMLLELQIYIYIYIYNFYIDLFEDIW